MDRRDGLPSRDELQDAELTPLKVVQWLEQWVPTDEEYAAVKRHLMGEAHAVDLYRASRFVESLAKALHPDEDEESFADWMNEALGRDI